MQTRDDYGFMPNWKRYAYYLAPFLAVTTLALYWLYFALRIRFTISAQNKEHATFPMAWVFIAVEISVAVPVFLQSFWSIFILKKRNRPRLRLVGNDVPTVDVFVTCCGEDDDLILDTARAACDVDYPQDRFRVVVLDDGRSESLERAITGLPGQPGLQETYPNLHYRSREKIPGVPHHFKAGNLNYGLEEVHGMPGGAGQFMAALDADMIPEQEWLRAIMPHMLIDNKMALACPPQVRKQSLNPSMDFPLT
jgi:cellulose synthase/poly-beta-1,6-N-acetylglucosamine synthase-like glycosyltransferase